MSESRPRLIVFDWDGTLVDSTAAIVHALRSAAIDVGVAPPSREQAAHVIGLGLQDAVRRAVPQLPHERLPDYLARYRYHFLKADAFIGAFEGIPQLLDELGQAGAWLAVATGKSRAGLDRALDRMGWGMRFVSTRCADEGIPKPDPWMLVDLCRELGVEPSETLMIGDTTHDLSMARDAGSRAIGVTYGAHPRAALEALPSVALVDTVMQLRKWLIGDGA
jgi:phosphoglycolate phosphatase